MAPLGAAAAPLLGRHLVSSAGGEFGSGRASSSLLGRFGGSSMTATAGLGDADPHANYRREVCEFFDEQRSPAQKLAFIHQILGRDMAEVRMFFERIEAFYASLTEEDRQAPAFIQQRDEIARDQLARDRYMTFARDVDRPQVRSRMVHVARTLGLAFARGRKAEIARMLSELLAGRSIGSAESIGLLAEQGSKPDDQLQRLERSPLRSESVSDAALLACLGSAEDRERVLRR